MLCLRNLLLCFILVQQNAACQVDQCLAGNCHDGYGDYQWANGQRYLGNFVDGKMEGSGIFYWARTYKYVGQWKAGKRTGKGQLYYPHGAIIKGMWANNRLQKIERKTTPLDAQDIYHGKHALSQITKDRPQMLQYLVPEDSLWQWVALQLAGQNIGSRIYWQAAESPRFSIPRGVNAVHAYPSDISEAKIWIADSKIPEKLWSGLIYELFNIRNAHAFKRIEHDVKIGLCNKKSYIRQFAELEYQAAQSLAEFYRKKWLPFCTRKGLKTDPQWWFCYLPDNFDSWINSFKNPAAYPWYPYAGYYDKIIRSVVEKY